MKADSSDFEIAPHVSVRLSGTGGQGLLLAGQVLAQATALYNDLNVVLTNSYGPEARGGASRSQVVMSKGAVDDLASPKVDILICLSQKACDRYFKDLRTSGLLIVDSTNVGVIPTTRAVEIPMTEMAREQCNNVMVTNIISLGVLCGYSNLVTLKALQSALKSILRPDLVKMNLKALKMGFDTVKDIIESLSAKERGRIRDFGFVREWKSKLK